MSESIQKPSELEEIKANSNFLRGNLAKSLDDASSHFEKNEAQILKFHGIYQQDDRDLRKALSKEDKEPAYSCMVRAKIPGGRLSAEQYLLFDDLSALFGNHTLRITTRQDIQLHGVLKHNLKAVVGALNKGRITTLGACGDVVRNVMVCPAPLRDRIKSDIYRYAKGISDHFLPHTGAYQAIWNDAPGAGLVKHAPNLEAEPIYGKTYLPRKFKIAMAFPGDNCVDVLTNDVGIVPEIAEDAIKGFTIFIGGGLGMSHGNPKTFPALAKPLCFVEPENLIKTVEAIVLIQRDFGDRHSRQHARLKYLISDKGIEWFRSQLDRITKSPCKEPRTVNLDNMQLHDGWNESYDGSWFLGLPIMCGRIKDSSGFKLKTALRLAIERYCGAVYLTPQQDMLLAGISHKFKDELESLLRSHGVYLPDEVSYIRKHAAACPALPTCPLAINESERVLPDIIDGLEKMLDEIRIKDLALNVHMTGCPNGCASPQMAELGLIGRTPDSYNIYVGGNHSGTRLNYLLAERISKESLSEVLKPIFVLYKKSSSHKEGFGDFCTRIGQETLRSYIGGRSEIQ